MIAVVFDVDILKRGNDNYCVDQDNNTLNKDSSADEGDKEEDNHKNAYCCFGFLLMLISENRSRSATFREVNQAAWRATALYFYVPISLYISPIALFHSPYLALL